MYDHYQVMRHIAGTPLIDHTEEKPRFFRASNIMEIEELFQSQSLAKISGLIAMDNDDIKFSENDNNENISRAYYSAVIFAGYKEGDIPSWLNAKTWCRQTAINIKDLLQVYRKSHSHGFTPNETLHDFAIFSLGRLFDFWAVQLNFTVTQIYCPEVFTDEYL